MTKYVTVQITPKGPTEAPPLSTGPGDVCKACGKNLSPAALAAALHVCPHCDHHHPVSGPDRVAQLADEGSWESIGEQLRPTDPLEFFDTRSYVERLAEAQSETGMSEAFIGGLCRMSGRPVALGVMDFRFLGGSMGSVVGERFVRLVAAAAEASVPLVVVVSSGGARMQEGILSLMQMAKTVVALDSLTGTGVPFVSVLTHPTTGGVLASFATLADVVVAEPGALLCFAGPRVIEQTTREKLPEGFGRSEANFANGQLDLVIHRRDLKERLGRVLSLLEGGVRCSVEPARQDKEVVSRGGNPLTQAFARVKKFALAPWGRLRGGDTEDPREP